MNEVAIIFAVNILASVLKRWVEPKWGKVGTQVTVFILATIGALYVTYGQTFAPLSEIVTGAISIFSLAVALYEVLLKRLPLFKLAKKK